MIGRRLSRLSDACNRVLGLAAVVGREFRLPVLNTLAELPEEQLLYILDEATAARLVQDVPGAPDRYAFTHALVRDTLYEELTAPRRARLHRLVAEAIERLAPSDDPPLADLAYHYAQAASVAVAHKAIEYAIRAAERAAAAFALEEAAITLRVGYVRDLQRRLGTVSTSGVSEARAPGEPAESRPDS